HKVGERTRIGTDVDVFGNLAVSSLPRVSDEGLVGLWRFDEGAGSIAVDATGTNDGTISGATYTTGVSGKALNFDGTNDYVEIAHNANQLLTGGGIITAWFNAGSAGGGGFGRIVDKSSGVSATGGFALHMNN